jgi:hypothetical protein
MKKQTTHRPHRTHLAAFTATALLGAAGCFGTAGPDSEIDSEQREKEQADIASKKLAIETSCPAGAPPCSCALKGQTVCQDPDRDGLLSLYDNCDYVANPNQANCDGDYSGDACDSNNVRITRTTQPYATTPTPTGSTTCIEDEYVHSVHFRQIEWRAGTQTIEIRRYCGPSGNYTTRPIIDEDISTYRCWEEDYFGCNFIGAEPPNPICG